MAPAPAFEGAFEHCRRLVAETDKERYWASLYAPAERRGALHALYAFDHEVSRVGAIVREPMAGHIRLQWWREVLEGSRDEEAAASPVAMALIETVRRNDLPAAELIGMIDAHAAALDGEAPGDIEAYAAATEGAVIALAAQILGGDSTEARHAASHAGIARVYADAGQADDARAHLDLAADILPRVPIQMLPAFLPAAIIRPSLGRETALPPWRRQWLIWRAGRDPRRIFT